MYAFADSVVDFYSGFYEEAIDAAINNPSYGLVDGSPHVLLKVQTTQADVISEKRRKGTLMIGLILFLWPIPLFICAVFSVMWPTSRMGVPDKVVRVDAFGAQALRFWGIGYYEYKALIPSPLGLCYRSPYRSH